MQTLIWVIVVYLILNSLIWIVRHATLSRAQKKAESLDSHFPLGRHPRLPKVSILVAGKNDFARGVLADGSQRPRGGSAVVSYFIDIAVF